MEHIAIEKETYALLQSKISNLSNVVSNHYNTVEVKSKLEQEWIEGAKLAETLGLTLRTLQNYRQQGKLGFSMIGKKVYYRLRDVEILLENNKTPAK